MSNQFDNYGQQQYDQQNNGIEPYGQHQQLGQHQQNNQVQQYGHGQQFGQPSAANPAGAQQGYVAPKSKVAAALLAFFLGTLGIHNFYLGYTGRGIAQLALTIIGWLTVWLIVGGVIIFGVGLWVFIEFIMILVGSGSYARSANGVPLT